MRRGVLLVLWLITDALLFLGAYAGAYFWRVGWLLSTDFPFDKHMTAAALAMPFFLSSLVATRTFGLTRNQRAIQNLLYILYASVLGVAAFTVLYYFLFLTFFSRLLLVQACVLSAVITATWHIAFGQVNKRLLRSNPPVYRALVVGVTRESSKLITELNAERNPIVPVAVLDARGAKEKDIDGVPVKGKLNKLEDVLRDDKITHLIQCADLEQSLNLLSACRSHGITYMLLPSVLGIVQGDERIENLAGRPVTVVNPREKRWMWFFR